MTIPTENLDAMIQFLTDVSETSGDHFMRAADMLRAQQQRLVELERQAAIGRRAVDMSAVLEIIEQALPTWDGEGIDPEKHHCEWTLLNERHRARSEIFGRLRDAEQAGMGGGVMSMTVRVRAHSEYHHLPDGTLGVVRAWAVHRRGVNGAIISMPDGRFDCVPIELLTLVSDAEQAAPAPATVAVDAGALAELREAMAQFRALPESAVWRPAGSVARERVMEAARRMLAGGGQ